MRIRDLLARRRREEDLQAEIAGHLAMATHDRVTDGQDPRAAHFAARKEFGNVTLTREATRLSWGGRWIEGAFELVRDGRYAMRRLGRSPGYTLVVILVLALGIGTNIVAFGLFKALALKPLAGVVDAVELHFIGGVSSSGLRGGISYPDFKYLRQHNQSYSYVAGSSWQPFSMGEGARSERVWGELVTGHYFQLLGVQPQLGRLLEPSDEVAPGRHPVAVITDALWARMFGRDPAVIGRRVPVNGYPLTIVGVTPPDFRGSLVGIENGVFIPLMMHPQLSSYSILDNPNASFLAGFGRPRPGIGLDAAQAESVVLAARLESRQPRPEMEQRLDVMPLWQSWYGAQTYMLPAVLVMGAMGTLLLVVVCANVAGLVSVRAVGRRAEVATRLALGASRVRIMRLLFIESLVLALAGATLGLLVPPMLEPFVGAAQASVPMPLFLNVEPDWTIVTFALALAGLTAVLFGIAPTLTGTRIDLAMVMKDGLSPRAAPRSRMRTALVVAQVAVSLVLIVGTGLMIRTLDAARRVDVGFDAANVTALSIDLNPNTYDDARGRRFYQDVLDALGGDHAIDSVSVSRLLPLMVVDNISTETFDVEGYPRRKDEDLTFGTNVVGPDYFNTLRIPLSAGREFERRDDTTAPLVVMVNETFAQRFWGSAAAAIGKRIQGGGDGWLSIVGVARDIKYARVDENPRPYVYFPSTQRYSTEMAIHARARGADPRLLDRVKGHLKALDPDVPILAARMLEEQTRFAVSIYDLVARMLGIFGAVAIALAALGIYGLIAYTVKESAHEIGVRTAVGASRGAILRRFLTRGVTLGVVGVLVGVLVALSVTRLMGTMLFGVAATDVASFAGASLLVLTTALLASLVPAWRGSRVDPIVALRHH